MRKSIGARGRKVMINKRKRRSCGWIGPGTGNANNLEDFVIVIANFITLQLFWINYELYLEIEQVFAIYVCRRLSKVIVEWHGN